MVQNSKIIFVCVVILLCAICSYCVTQYTNEIVLGHLYETSPIYSIFSRVSSSITALIPLIIFLFLYGTIDIMVNTFFEMQIKRTELFYIVGVSLTPFLLYQYFFWYNIIEYCHSNIINTAQDFYNIKYFFNLSFYDINFIGTIC